MVEACRPSRYAANPASHPARPGGNTQSGVPDHQEDAATEHRRHATASQAPRVVETAPWRRSASARQETPAHAASVHARHGTWPRRRVATLRRADDNVGFGDATALARADAVRPSRCAGASGHDLNDGVPALARERWRSAACGRVTARDPANTANGTRTARVPGSGDRHARKTGSGGDRPVRGMRRGAARRKRECGTCGAPPIPERHSGNAGTPHAPARWDRGDRPIALPHADSVIEGSREGVDDAGHAGGAARRRPRTAHRLQRKRRHHARLRLRGSAGGRRRPPGPDYFLLASSSAE